MATAKYCGTLTYSGLENASIVRSLQLISSDWLALDITEKRGKKSGVTARLLGIAEKQAMGVFRTPWIYLTNLAGEDLVELEEPYAQMTLEIVEAEVDHLQVIGKWHEWEDEQYEFTGRLLRLRTEE